MIAELKGNITAHTKDSVVLDVSGVGYRVHMIPDTVGKLTAIPRPVRLFVHLSVRETSLDLYGFLIQKELDFFEMLISISGIGPRSGLAIIGLADVETLTSAIASGDTSYLTKVSGIGKKNAQKIVIELRDKLGAVEHIADEKVRKEEEDTLEALQALGYSLREARDALKQVPKDVTDATKRLKEALKSLGK